MIAAPSIALLTVLAGLSFNAANILTKRWHKRLAIVCGAGEALGAAFLLGMVSV